MGYPYRCRFISFFGGPEHGNQIIYDGAVRKERRLILKGCPVEEYKKSHQAYKFRPFKIGQIGKRETCKESRVREAVTLEQYSGHGYQGS